MNEPKELVDEQSNEWMNQIKEWTIQSNELANQSNEWINQIKEWTNQSNEWANQSNDWTNQRNQSTNQSNEWMNQSNEWKNNRTLSNINTSASNIVFCLFPYLYILLHSCVAS